MLQEGSEIIWSLKTMKKRIEVYIGQTKSKSISISCVTYSNKVYNEMLDLALQYSDDQLDEFRINQPAKEAVIDTSILDRIVERTQFLKTLSLGNMLGRTHQAKMSLLQTAVLIIRLTSSLSYLALGAFELTSEEA